MVKPLTVMVALPPLTRAMVWTVDVVARAWLKKFVMGGATPVVTVPVLGTEAVPFRVRAWGLPVALSTRVTVAVRAPAAVPPGENVAVTVQDVVTTVQLLVILKSAAFVPPSVTDVKVTVPPEGVTLAVIAVLVVPMACVPKVRGLGAMTSVGG